MPVSRTSDPSPDLLLRAQDIASTCSISIRQVWVLAARGELPPPVNLGRATRWRQSDISRWLASGAASGQVPPAAPSDDAGEPTTEVQP